MNESGEYELETDMTLDEYQEAASDFAIYPGRLTETGYLYTALGLAGEAGECAEKAKKALRDDAGIMTAARIEALAGELGDVLWYVAMFADELGLSLSEIAQGNIDKLSDRFKRGALQGDGDDR